MSRFIDVTEDITGIKCSISIYHIEGFEPQGPMRTALLISSVRKITISEPYENFKVRVEEERVRHEQDQKRS